MTLQLVERESQDKQQVRSDWQILYSEMPAHLAKMVRFEAGKIPVVTLNSQQGHSPLSATGGHGRLSAHYRQLSMWGIDSAVLYDCLDFDPDSIAGLVVDGQPPQCCLDCPLLYREENNVFCPALMGLKAYMLRKQFESIQLVNNQ